MAVFKHILHSTWQMPFDLRKVLSVPSSTIKITYDKRTEEFVQEHEKGGEEEKKQYKLHKRRTAMTHI